MPSQLLHVLFGEDVFARIGRRLESRFGTAAGGMVTAWGKIAAVQRKAFVLGCQGPDIFYHSQGRRPVGLEYGTLLHRRGAGTFTAELLGSCFSPPGADTRTRRPENEINALGAYSLGFMTHAILDRLAHPYIVYKSDSSCSAARFPGIPRFEGSHAFFERIIDVMMFKLLRGKEIASWDQGILAESCESPPPGLKELLAGALIAAFPGRAGKDEKLKSRVENTFLDSAGFYRLTAPACPRDDQFPPQKRHLVYLYPEELPGGIDFLNLEKQPWYYPAGEKKEDRRSFPEIYGGAVAAAADSFTGIISRYLEEGSFPAETAAVIGDGGLNIVDENGKPCAPSRTDPLPLEDVLEQQAVLHKL